MIGSMRHRDPTTAELSPGLYLDKHCSETPILTNDPTKSNLESGLYTAPTAATSKASRVSPVLSRMHPSNITNCFSQSSRVQRQDFKSKYHGQVTGLNSSQDTSKSGRYINHRKVRKKGKRETRFQMNGNIDQNFHSLKVTIRRTYKSNKLENGICAIVNTPEDNINHDSMHRSFGHMDNNATGYFKSQQFGGKMNEDAYSSESLSARVSSRLYADSSTSTVDSATLTEPNLLGPCEPGTKIVVEGVVWLEATGMLVLSLHWRGRNYMGTLLDSSKQTFGPTCMDKGVASALNLLRGRKSWCDSSQRGYQARGIHHFHHMRHHRRGGGHGAGISMTTRSASAAAAATSQDSTEGEVDSKEQSVVHDPYSTECIDQPYVPLDIGYSKRSAPLPPPPTDIPKRGAKGRRRRGAGRRQIRPVNVLSPPNESSVTPGSEIRQASTDDVESRRTPLTDNGTTNSDSNLPISCPFTDCKKRFADILSMRYHFTLGHSAQTMEMKNAHSSVIVQSLGKKVNSMKNADNGDDDDDDQLEISVCDISASSSPPPKLARAHGVKDRSSDSNDTSLVLINGDDMDDNIDPPKLHRIVSIPDSFCGVHPTGVGGDGDSSPSSKFEGNHHTLVDDIPDEPPAASPAYSDISDDGTVSSSTTNIPTLNMAAVTVNVQTSRETLLNSPSILSSNLSNQPSISQGYIDVSRRLNLSPLILSACSPTILGAGEPGKLYLPANLFPSNLKGVGSIFYQTTSPTVKCIDKQNTENGLKSTVNNSPITFALQQKESPSRPLITNNNCYNGGVSTCSSNSLHNLSGSQSSSLSTNGTSLLPPSNQNNPRPLTFLSVSPGLMTEQNTRPSSTGPFLSNPPVTFCVSRNSPIPPIPGVSDQRILSPHNTNHYPQYQPSTMTKPCE
ncbi:unnamed protein product [Heterobilharzia americana]|nr:unnamed protein product [Heterobilharzia americana]